MRFVKCLLITLFFVTIFVGTANANAGYSDPTQFWLRFRQAVLENDISAIITLTHFPFRTRGPIDGSPIIQHDKKNFPNIYKKLITQEEELMTSDGKLVSKTMFELIKEKRVIVPKDFNIPDCLWIYAFKFKKINGCWYLTWAYTDD
jgi:hypothetical protein